MWSCSGAILSGVEHRFTHTLSVRKQYSVKVERKRSSAWEEREEVCVLSRSQMKYEIKKKTHVASS